MSHLQSGGNSNSNIIPKEYTHLNGTNNFTAWIHDVMKYAKTHGGTVGHNLFTDADIIPDYPHPGEPPRSTDMYVNPQTGETIHNTPKYAREPLPVDEINLDTMLYPKPSKSIFNTPLTEKGQMRFDKDVDRYDSNLKHHKDECKDLRGLDTGILQHVHRHIPDELLSLIELNEDYATYTALPSNFYHRTKKYLRIVSDVFSKGNVKLITNNLLKACIDPQGERSYPQWQATHNKNWAPAIKSIEDPEFPGMIKSSVLEFAFMTLNLKDSIENKTAQNNYYIKHKFEMDPRALTSELVASNISLADYKADPISQQGSALMAASSPIALAAIATTSNWGKKDPSRSDHCTSCVDLTKGKEYTRNGVKLKGPFYFYNHNKDNCTRQQKINAAKARNTKANLAAAGLPATPPAPSTTTLPSSNDIMIANMVDARLSQLLSIQNNNDILSMMSNSSHPQQP